jgi:hypothetical protein
MMQRHEIEEQRLREAPFQEERWLLGQPPLKKYLDFVDDVGIREAVGDRASLVDAWRMANDYYDELEKQEASIADTIECMPLDASLAPLAAAMHADPRYRRTFDTLPTRIAMVELDRLVVCQNHVTQTFVEELKLKLGPGPDPQSLFRFCLPVGEYSAPVQIRSVDSKRFVFQSESTDFRFHEALLLRPEQIQNYNTFGEVASVLGLVVGFSSNFLNAICDDDSNRLLLHNGYHRACALRELGITHAPCVIQTVTRRDELDIIAKPIVARDPGYFFNAPRPPLLKDFWNPRISKLLQIKRVRRTIELSFEIRDYFMQE